MRSGKKTDSPQCCGEILKIAPLLVYCEVLLSLFNTHWSRAFEQTAVGLQSEGYLTRGAPEGDANPQPGRKEFHSYINFSGTVDRRSGDFGFFADGFLKLGLQEFSESIVWPRQAWVGYQTSAMTEVGLGLKAGAISQPWSELDQEWKPGIWEPRNRRDPLHPETMGLVGLEVNWKTQTRGVEIESSLMGSPLFVPDIGPSIDLENLTSTSPWFWSPPKTLAIFGQGTATQYTVQYPSIGDTVFRPGVAGRLRAELKEGAPGLWGQLSYANKPIAQTFFAYDGFLQLPQLQAQVTVLPRFLRHQLTGFDFGYRKPQVSTWVSLIAENPIRDQTPAGSTTQEISNAFYSSAGLRIKLDRSQSSPTLKGAYFKASGGVEGDQGPLATSGESIFEPRFLYREATRLGAEVPIGFKKSQMGLVLNSEWTRESAFGDSIFSAGCRLNSDQNISFSLGVDFLISGAQGAVNSQSQFIERNRANDRVVGGMQYVF